MKQELKTILVVVVVSATLAADFAEGALWNRKRACFEVFGSARGLSRRLDN